MIRVLLVDDHPVVQGGLALALRAEHDIEIAGVAPTVAAAREILASVEIDVALLDVRLPDGSGLDLLATPRSGRPACIILSSFDLPQYIARAVRLGAAGYLLKTAPMAEVLGAIRTAAAGQVTFGAQHLAIARMADERRLSARERDLVRAVIAGHTNDEIGMALGLQRKTIETYLSRLYQRFDCVSRSELAARAVAEGWLEE